MIIKALAIAAFGVTAAGVGAAVGSVVTFGALASNKAILETMAREAANKFADVLFTERETGFTVRNDVPTENDDFVMHEVIVGSYGEAQEVLDKLQQVILKYGFATVADLYELGGLTTHFSDTLYGWDAIHGASVVSESFNLFRVSVPEPSLLPKPIPAKVV